MPSALWSAQNRRRSCPGKLNSGAFWQDCAAQRRLATSTMPSSLCLAQNAGVLSPAQANKHLHACRLDGLCSVVLGSGHCYVEAIWVTATMSQACSGRCCRCCYTLDISR